MGEGVVENPENNASNLKQLLKGDKSIGDALSNADLQFFSHYTINTIGQLCLTKRGR